MPTEQQYMVSKGHSFVSKGRRRYPEYTVVTKDMIPEGWTLEDLLENGTLSEVEVYSPEKPKKTTSPWQFDPAKLEKMDADKLNLMIADIDDGVGPFETREEALAQLTRDFQKTK